MTRRLIAAVGVMLLCIALPATSAHARHHKKITHKVQTIEFCGDRYCGPSQAVAREVTTRRGRVYASDSSILGGRPPGCPYRFCGCEASRYVFGEIRPELNLASNWIRKFPRAAPAPGMAAARSGHVMILISHVSGSDWLVHDGNSGGGMTRRHVRSINGLIIVDPHGSRVAAR